MAFIILIEEETFQQGPATCEEGTALSLTKVLEPVLGLNTVQNNTSSTKRSNKTPTRGRDHSEDKGPEAGVAPACLRDSVEACVADVKRLREEQYEARSEVTWQVRLVGHWRDCSFHWVSWEATQQRNDMVWIMFVKADFGCHDKITGEQRQEQRDQFGENIIMPVPQSFQTTGIHGFHPRLVSVSYSSPLQQQHCLSPSCPV